MKLKHQTIRKISPITSLLFSSENFSFYISDNIVITLLKIIQNMKSTRS
jgi:hypothetical protein